MSWAEGLGVGRGQARDMCSHASYPFASSVSNDEGAYTRRLGYRNLGDGNASSKTIFQPVHLRRSGIFLLVRFLLAFNSFFAPSFRL